MKFPEKSKTLVAIAVIGLIAGIVYWVASPMKPLDLSKDEVPFPSIGMPPQAVYGCGYMDGGSVGILIIDHSGVRHEISFPIDYDGIRNAYPTAFFGNMNAPKKTMLKNPRRAKEIVIRLLDEFGKEMNDPRVDCDDSTARARRALSSSPDVVAIRAYEKMSRTLGF